MISGLYECFQHWANDGSVYIISDLHFDDADCKIMNKNWITPQEQVDIINKKAHKPDTLIVLGDVGNINWIRKLKAGRKILILGNHDGGATNYRRVNDYKIFVDEQSAIEFYNERKAEGSYCNLIDCSVGRFPHYTVVYDNKLFDEVYEGPLFISEKIMLSHEPCELPFAANIHGHDHAGEMYHGNSINVAANVCNFMPISLTEEIKKGLISKVPTIHRICIDRAIKNPIHKKGVSK